MYFVFAFGAREWQHPLHRSRGADAQFLKELVMAEQIVLGFGIVARIVQAADPWFPT